MTGGSGRSGRGGRGRGGSGRGKGRGGFNNKNKNNDQKKKVEFQPFHDAKGKMTFEQVKQHVLNYTTMLLIPTST